MLNHKAIQYVTGIILFLLYFILAYNIQRHETGFLLIVYSVIFIIYAWILFKSTKEQSTFWIKLSVGLRFLVLFSIPNLSDDFYRFIWDGRLMASGYHPFSHIPSYYIKNQIAVPGIDELLYSKLNSKNYFTIYPPVAQFLFWISAKLSTSIYGSLIVFKLFILSAEIGSIVMIRRIATQLNLSHLPVLVYALNPLVIIELTGNAHFEAVVIFFVILSYFYVLNQKLILAAVFLSIAICTKLIPLIFLPAILPLMGWKKALRFYAMTAMTSLLLFLPLLNMEIITGLKNSLVYYFSRFEFNASVYYIVRWLGYIFIGYNIIHIAGGVLAAVATLLILKISLRQVKRNGAEMRDHSLSKDYLMTFVETMMWSLLIYFLFTTTLHPWYVTTLLALSVFTKYKFVILWTFTIFLSYAGYTLNGFEENLWVVAFEYSAVLGYLAFELLWKRHSSLSFA